MAQEGDTLAGIATRYGIDLGDLIAANNLNDNVLEPGEAIFVPGGTIPEPQPAPVEQPQAVEIGAFAFHPRKAWTATSIDASNADIMGKPLRITVHHTGLEEHLAYDGIELLRRIESAHRAQGWAGIGYHFIIDANGSVWEGRPLKFQGAHARGDNNIKNIGITLAGDFNDRTPNPAMLKALQTSLDGLRRHFGIPKHRIFGHQKFVTTDCPGARVMPMVAYYRKTGRLSR
jgi:hypothetical protein